MRYSDGWMDSFASIYFSMHNMLLYNLLRVHIGKPEHHSLR